MKKVIAAVFLLVLIVAVCPTGYAQALDEVYYDMRNTLSIVSYQVDWVRVITDDILIQAKFELRNDTKNRIVIRRIGLVIGDEYDIEDVMELDSIDRSRFLYSRQMDDPDYPGEAKSFFAEIQIDSKSIAKELDPGETVTAKFACILDWYPHDISLVKALLMDKCEIVKQ